MPQPVAVKIPRTYKIQDMSISPMSNSLCLVKFDCGDYICFLTLDPANIGWLSCVIKGLKYKVTYNDAYLITEFKRDGT